MPAEAKPARRGYVLAVLTAIYVFNSLDRHIIGILAEPIRHDLRINDTQFGVLTGFAFALFYTGFGIPAGWLADRLGRVRVITAACMVWSLCSAAGALAGSFGTLALARIGVGVGEAGGTAPSYSLISAHYPPHQRASALGLFHLGSALALLIGGSFGAWVANVWGWRWALAVVSLPGLGFALLLWRTVAEPPRGEPLAGGRESLSGPIRAFAATPLLRLTALAAGLSAMGTYGLLAWLPAFLMRAKGMTLGDIAVWYGIALALSSALGLGTAGWLADRWARRTARAHALVPLLALLGAALCIALAVRAPGWPMAMVFGVFANALGQMFVSPLQAIVQNTSPPASRSLFSAIFLLVNNLIGAGFGPLYVGMVSDRMAAGGSAAPLAGGLLALVPVLLLAAWLLWRVGTRLKREA